MIVVYKYDPTTGEQEEISHHRSIGEAKERAEELLKAAQQEGLPYDYGWSYTPY